MSKSLPWLIVVVLVIAILYGGSYSMFRIKFLDGKAEMATRQADSLRTVNAQLSDSVEVHKLNASKANAIAEELMKTDPQVIVDERVKLNRYATAEKVGEGLVKKLP